MPHITEEQFNEIRSACQMPPSVWAWLRIYGAMREIRGHKDFIYEQVMPYVHGYLSRWPSDVVTSTGSYAYSGSAKGESTTLCRSGDAPELTFCNSIHFYQAKVKRPVTWTQWHSKESFQNIRMITLCGPDPYGDAVSRNICGTKVTSLKVLSTGENSERSGRVLMDTISKMKDPTKTALTEVKGSAMLLRALIRSELRSELCRQVTSLGFVEGSLSLAQARDVVRTMSELRTLDLSRTGEFYEDRSHVLTGVGNLLSAAPDVQSLSVCAGLFRDTYVSGQGDLMMIYVDKHASQLSELTVQFGSNKRSSEDVGRALVAGLAYAPGVRRLNLKEAPKDAVSGWSGIRLNAAGYGREKPWFHRNVFEERDPHLVPAVGIEHIDLSGLGTQAVCTSSLVRPVDAFDVDHNDPRGFVSLLRKNLGSSGTFPNLKQLTLDSRIRSAPELWGEIVSACAEHGVVVDSVWHNPFEW